LGVLGDDSRKPGDRDDQSKGSHQLEIRERVEIVVSGIQRGFD
jgi:hypothetical protein